MTFAGAVKRITVGAVLVIIAFFAGHIAGFNTGIATVSGAPRAVIPDGTYSIAWMHPMFTRRSRKPVYLLVAEHTVRIKSGEHAGGIVHVGDYKLYIVPRTSFDWPPPNNREYPTPELRMIMFHGNGTVIIPH